MSIEVFEQLKTLAKQWLSNIRLFSKLVIHRQLFAYQLTPANAIIQSVLYNKGLEFAVLFPRQSGKNETQAQLEAYLLNLFQRVPGAQIVKAQPTLRPQALNAMHRLEGTLCNDWTAGRWRKKEDYIYELDRARMLFFSAEPSANVVGATASLLLEGDEAQDILESEWARKFEPMMAFTNATSVLWGTAWTGNTLLAKTIKRLKALEAADGVRRVFVVSPDEVAKENKAYGQFVERQIAKYGRQHPFVKTQFFNEEINSEGGMFPPARRAMLFGSHPRQDSPTPGRLYAATIDIAGEDEAIASGLAALDNPKRDSTVLRIVEVDLSTQRDALIGAPTYKTVHMRSWIGVKHTSIYAQLRAVIQHWNPAQIVADATGVGAGLVSFLSAAFPDRVLAFDFSGPSKSQLGWDLLALAETGRCLHYTSSAGSEDEHTATYRRQLEFCQYEIVPGPARSMRWGVPDGTRDPATGEHVHDDYIITAALCSQLDQLEWTTPGPTLIIHQPDPLEEMSHGV